MYNGENVANKDICNLMFLCMLLIMFFYKSLRNMFFNVFYLQINVFNILYMLKTY